MFDCDVSVCLFLYLRGSICRIFGGLTVAVFLLFDLSTIARIYQSHMFLLRSPKAMRNNPEKLAGLTTAHPILDGGAIIICVTFFIEK